MIDLPGMSRREFAAWVGTALAAAGVGGCGKPPREKILPYASQPEGLVPGKPLYYATTLPRPDGALGLLVRSEMGRPTKIEGNPRHPASLGATDPAAQAEIVAFWNPDRATSILRGGAPGTWPGFQSSLDAALSGPRRKNGAGLRILTESVTSPTAAAQLQRLTEMLPEARWHAYDSDGRDSVRAGHRLAFGVDVDPVYRLDRADVIVSLGADLLSRTRESADHASRRGRLYCAESAPTATGSAADHRWPVRAGDMEVLAHELALELGVLPGPGNPRFEWLPALARDLRRHAGRSLVAAGKEQPPIVHALAAALNHSLGNVGRTLTYVDPPQARPEAGLDSIGSLAADMAAGRVEILILLGGNPVYAAPADLDFEQALQRVPFRVYLGPAADETSWFCTWHVPRAHFLEAWGDARAFDGTASLIQPLIAPLYQGRTETELLAILLGEPGRSPYELLRDYWRRGRDPKSFEAFWRTALHEGVIEGSAFAARSVEPKLDAIRAQAAPAPAESIELVFRPDPTIGDGRHANNPWLQELPKPLTKLTWDNAALIAPAMAARLGLENGDEVRIDSGGRSLPAPAWIVPGHADGSVTLHLGYGRTKAGRFGSGRGVNAGLLRTRDRFSVAQGIVVQKTGRRTLLASTQLHHSMEGRDLARTTTVERQGREFPKGGHGGGPSLYPDDPKPENAWGMVIDLDACTACNACVVACQAENNIPVVGKGEVLRGREMHWIRVDTYHEGPVENPRIVHQPVPCMHCEKAPCEIVCPTFATAHSSEGLNQMTYNRCVGTRYCQNNCPYKVRRFNFFQYADTDTPSMQLLYNPDVTVRERGVMEKCTYCVQRILRTRIDAGKEGRPIRDGEVKTACQQVCPSRAIEFGDLSRPDSAVSKRRASPLNYELLGELQTRPRTTYLARVRNPNPELEGA